MNIKLHKQATTTPKIRAEIQAAPSSLSDSELARQFNVSDSTIRRWRYRDDVHNRRIHATTCWPRSPTSRRTC